MSAAAGARILVVDDDPGLLDLIEMRLAAQGYAVSCAASGEEALERFRGEHPRLVISDLRMEGMDGHALFSRLHAEAPSVPVILLTAHGTIPDAVAATQRGVFAFLTKPFDGQELLAKVAEAMAISPPLDMSAGEGWRAGIVSCSLAMDELLRRAHRAADGNEPILISGPRGAGKETLARAIHAAGPRAGRPFGVVRCEDAAPVDFGAALAAAAGGIVYLKGVDELSAADQARLLPLVRERGPFEAAPRAPADARVIGATCQPLDQAIRDGEFRADLFYALGRVALNVPPLAERREDVPLLVHHFVARHGAGRGFSPEAMSVLRAAAWPGNVRQLRSVVEQALAQAVTSQVPASLVRSLLRKEIERDMSAFHEARRNFERDYLVRLLEATGGNVSQAARVARRNRTEFYKLLARHEIDPARFKSGS